MSNSQAVKDFRKRLKLSLIYAFGEKCQICKNSYPSSVYEFHHLNPSTKNFSISGDGNTRSKEKIANEAYKCIMVCANCHRLIEHENLDIKDVVSVFDIDKFYQMTNKLANKNQNEKVKRVSRIPSREILKQEIRNLPFLQIAKKYNVSDNAVRKWCIKYNLPSKKKDIKAYTDEEWDLL